MSDWRRYGIFVVPEAKFYRMGAQCLGWDSVTGAFLPHPELEGLPQPLSQITQAPRKYGFHGTLKPPFRLATDKSEADLVEAVERLCRTLAPVSIPRLAVRRLGGFVAVVPEAPSAELERLAAQTVEALDPCRADLTEAELARRRKAGLSARQDDLLRIWGYPYVMEEFRFHLTLTGRLGRSAEAVAARLALFAGPSLPSPFVIDSLCVMGEADDGMFHLLLRVPLSA